MWGMCSTLAVTATTSDSVSAMSSEFLDDLDEFVGFVAVAAGVVQEFFCSFGDGALLWGAGDGDAAAAAELEQAFVAEFAEGA